ncbi:MAG: LamG domain-containing protein [Patescibacteria group bacterium]
MITPELKTFISDARSRGMSDGEIRQALLANGWMISDIDEAMGQVKEVSPSGFASQPQAVNPVRVNPVWQTPQQTPKIDEKKSSVGGILLFLFILFIILVGWGVFAYYGGLWPFAKEEDTSLVKKEDNSQDLFVPSGNTDSVLPDESATTSEAQDEILPNQNQDEVKKTCVVPPAGLLAWYSGSDTSAPNNNALKGGATYATGFVGEAFSLNGTDAYVVSTSGTVIDPTTKGSLSAWVKFNSLPSASHIMQIIGKGSDGKDFDLQVNKDNKFRMYVGSGTSVASKTLVKTGVWYHVVGTWDSDSTVGLKMYVNGVLENTNSILVTRKASGQNLQIGHHPVFSGRFFHGLVDEVEVWDRALSASEISTIFNAGEAGKCEVASF